MGNQQMGLYLLNLSHDPWVLNQFPDLQEVKDTSLLAYGAVGVFFFSTMRLRDYLKLDILSRQGFVFTFASRKNGSAAVTRASVPGYWEYCATTTSLKQTVCKLCDCVLFSQNTRDIVECNHFSGDGNRHDLGLMNTYDYCAWEELQDPICWSCNDFIPWKIKRNLQAMCLQQA